MIHLSCNSLFQYFFCVADSGSVLSFSHLAAVSSLQTFFYSISGRTLSLGFQSLKICFPVRLGSNCAFRRTPWLAFLPILSVFFSSFHLIAENSAIMRRTMSCATKTETQWNRSWPTRRRKLVTSSSSVVGRSNTESCIYQACNRLRIEIDWRLASTTRKRWKTHSWLYPRKHSE